MLVDRLIDKMERSSNHRQGDPMFTLNSYAPDRFFDLSPDQIAAFTDREAVDAVLAAWEAVCRAEAIQARATARLTRIRPDARGVADELAWELPVSRQAAAVQVDLAQCLLTRLPRVLAAMDIGKIDLNIAKKIYEVTSPLSDELCGEVDEKLTDQIIGKDPAAVRRAAREAAHAVDPDGYASRAEKRRKDRKVELVHEEDAMASLWVYLPAEVAAAAYARVDAIARKRKTRNEERTLGQLRADVVAELLLGKHGGLDAIAAQVYVHVPIDAASGLFGARPLEPGRSHHRHPEHLYQPVEITDTATENPDATGNCPVSYVLRRYHLTGHG
jgi:Domain of unknown function (DUF222)